MRGTVIYVNDRWSIKYPLGPQASKSVGMEFNTVALSKIDSEMLSKAFTEKFTATVEFEYAEEYVEPDDSIHCNRGDFVKRAKIVKSNSEKWQEVRTYVKNKISDEHYALDLDTVLDILENFYEPPVKISSGREDSRVSVLDAEKFTLNKLT